LSSARGRSGSVILVAAAIVGAAWLWWPAQRYDCETLVGQSLAKLDQADKDMKASATAGTAAKCAAYRERVSALAELAKMPAACGPPPKRSGAWPSPNDERKWYENLIFEECR
jgi:hypothetical protein